MKISASFIKMNHESFVKNNNNNNTKSRYNTVNESCQINQT